MPIPSVWVFNGLHWKHIVSSKFLLVLIGHPVYYVVFSLIFCSSRHQRHA